MASRQHPPKWLHPKSQEREYERALLALTNSVKQAVNNYVSPLLSELRQDAPEDMPMSSGWHERLRQAFIRAGIAVKGDTQQAYVNAVKIAKATGAFNALQFHRILKRAYGVDVTTSEPWLNDLMIQWEADNLKLIRSLPSEALDRMQGKIIEAVRTGQTAKDMGFTLSKEYGIMKNRGRLISRDQIGKLNGRLTEHRQKGVGVTHYIWHGVLDQRERDAHVAREGEQFAWAKPPDDGSPGEPIQCRCWAEPVLPELADLNGAISPLPARGFSLTNLGAPA